MLTVLVHIFVAAVEVRRPRVSRGDSACLTRLSSCDASVSRIAMHFHS